MQSAALIKKSQNIILLSILCQNKYFERLVHIYFFHRVAHFFM